MSINRNMDLVALRSFVLSEQLGSFSAAAKGLNCSQAALSLRIKKLESMLETELFHRNYHSLKLTVSGELLLPKAVAVLAAHDEMIAAARQVGERERLHIGLPEDMTRVFFQRYLAQLPNSLEPLEVELSMRLCRELIDMTCDDQLDVAVVNALPDYIGGQQLASRPLRWVCSKDFNWRPNQPIPLAVHPEGCIYRSHTQRVLEAIGLPYQIVFSAQGTISVQAAVSAGLGLTVVAEGVIPQDLVVAPQEWQLPELGHVDIRLFNKGRLGPLQQAFVEDLKLRIPEIF